jgi:hypothetical protein
MRLGWLAVPWLIAAPACNPVAQYQAAARSLRCTLVRVEPSLQLALPLEQSRVRFRITLQVVNPSSLPFHLQGFEGAFRLESDGQMRPLGQLAMVRPLDLPANGQADLEVELVCTCQDLADRWPDLLSAVRGQHPGAWSVEGTLRGTVHGFPVRLPVRTRHRFGPAGGADPDGSQP